MVSPAPDHDGVATFYRHVVGAEELHNARRCARQRPGSAHDQPSQVHRMNAVHILRGVDEKKGLFLVQTGRKRELQEDGVNRGSSLKRTITLWSSACVMSAGSCSWNESMPTSALSACLRAT